jgi:hypothetical protein
MPNGQRKNTGIRYHKNTGIRQDFKIILSMIPTWDKRESQNTGVYTQLGTTNK